MAALRAALNSRTEPGRARLVALAGASLTLAGLALTLLVRVLVPTGDTVPVRLEKALTTDALLALLALFGVLVSLRWLLLAAPVLLLASVGSVVLGYGWYFVLLPSPLAMIGVGGLLYGVSAVMMTVAGAAESSRGGAVREGRS